MNTAQITTCKDCPHVDRQRRYTADSFEFLEVYRCGKYDNKVIADYVEVFDKDVEIPDWCPILTDK